MEVHDIGGESYAIYWENVSQGTTIHSGTGLTAFNIETSIAKLDNE